MNRFVALLSLFAMVSAGPKFEEFLGTLKIGNVCATDKSLKAYTVSTFTVEPWEPTKGSTVSVVSTGTFTSAQTITGVTAEVYYLGLKITTQTVPQSGTFTAGEVGIFSFDQAVPASSPKGKYRITASLINSQNAQVNCWEVTFNLA